jgi:hypothetical protein
MHGVARRRVLRGSISVNVALMPNIGENGPAIKNLLSEPVRRILSLDSNYSGMRVRRITIRLNIPEWIQHAGVAAFLVSAAVTVFCLT